MSSSDDETSGIDVNSRLQAMGKESLTNLMRYSMLCCDCAPSTRTRSIVALFRVADRFKEFAASVHDQSDSFNDITTAKVADAAFRSNIAGLLVRSKEMADAYLEWHREFGPAFFSVIYDNGRSFDKLHLCCVVSLTIQQLFNLNHLYDTVLQHTDMSTCRIVSAFRDPAGYISNVFNANGIMVTAAGNSVKELLQFPGTKKEHVDQILEVPMANDMISRPAIYRALEAREGLGQLASVLEGLGGAGGSSSSSPGDLLSRLQALQRRLESSTSSSGKNNNRGAPE
jgi:hypothetical protein